MLEASILIVDDDRDILETARMFLKTEFSRITIESDPTKILNHMTTDQVDVILLDMNFRRGLNDGEEGFYWLDRIMEVDKEAIVILITAYGEVDLAVNAMKKGAAEAAPLIPAPFRGFVLCQVLCRFMAPWIC